MHTMPLPKRKSRALRLSAACAAVLLGIPATPAATPVIDHYISTGDNLFVGTFLPFDSPAAINASFDLLKDVYGTRRIYWRGLQESKYTEGTARPENVVIYKNILSSRDLLDNQHINQLAVNAAHARGMQIWGVDQIYDFGTAAKDPVFYGFPGEQEHYLRTDHPEWIPVDKYGDRQQGGPIEYAYPEARQAMVNWVSNEVNQAGYDGVQFYTYAENFTMRFPDEFGFSDPIVNEFKARYGVDIRKESFNHQDWYNLRGEYTTQFLSQLHATMSAAGKGVGMSINPLALDKPQYWIGNNFSVAGDITMNWQKWATDRDVDSLLIYGSVDTAYFTVKNAVAGSGVEVSLGTSDIYYPPLANVRDAGGPMMGAYNYDQDYLLRSNIPVQPLSSLSNPDVYKRMRVLAQIINGDTTATAADVTPLLSDSNLITRRLALTALGKIADASSVPSMEAALSDPEHSVRAAALYALAQKNRPESAQAILNAINNYSNSQLIEGAVAALRTIPTALPLLETTVQTSTNADVRSVAMRSLAVTNSAVPASMVPTFQNALSDPEPYVRAFAVDALGRVSGSAAGVGSLIGNLASYDPVLSDRSATTLRTMIRSFEASATARRTDIVNGLDSLFRKTGDDSQRSDASWGYVQVGNALYDLVPDGFGKLTAAKNQRTDRALSLHAWEIQNVHLAVGTFTTVTEAADAYAHFKKPHWDNITTLRDSFDLKPTDATINNQKGEIGQTWTVTQGNVADNIVQTAINNGGKALKTIRRAGGSHEVRLSSDVWDGQAAELTQVTAKGDWYRTTTGDATAFGLDIGAGIEAQFLIDGNSFYRIWQTDGTQNGGSYLQTNYKAGVGGWETVEVVAKLGLANSGSMLGGTYDVYLSREGNSSLGGLGRTLIAGNVPIHSVAERTNEQLFISNQPNGASDVTTYWDNVSIRTAPALNPFPVKVDLNGGAIADARPNTAGFTAWDDLPSNKSGADNGYGTRASASRQLWTGGVSSGLINATISSIDVGGGNYLGDHPVLNSRDATVAGREFNGSGSFTPTKDSLYRDQVSADVGTATVNNGTNHRLELKLDGLDPETTYRVKLYAYDNTTPRSVNVFTDVTSNATMDLPAANSIDGLFTPGEGAAGTQWAPAQQYIDGTTSPTFPASDDFRALTLYLKSDASGRIFLDQTTVTGLSGISQPLPVLNGFEITAGQSTWNGANGASWNSAGNWAEGDVPTGKGRNATFAGMGGSVNVQSPVTVGFINLTGSNYTIGGATITLDDNSVNSSVSGGVTGRAAIAVGSTSSFNQLISSPLMLAKDTTVTVTRAQQTLTLSSLQSSNSWLTKAGPGTLALNNVRATGLAVNGGRVHVLPGRSAGGTSAVGSLTVTAGATLDLADQDMVINYSAATPIAAIRSLLASAFAGGSWTGTGITSSTAATIAGNPSLPHKTALGYAEAADVLAAGASSFSGQPVDGTTVILRYTLAGDANLDGTVNALDFNAVASNFGGSMREWANGDYNYDGTVNSMDFAAVAMNFNQLLPAPAALPLAASLVPEPSAALLAVCAASIVVRRRRAGTC
jgi:HEAT repeat protein